MVASSAVNCSSRRRLGQVALGEDRDVEAELEGGGGLVEHPEAGEQGERAAAGRLDQVAELVGERLDVAGVPRVGEVGGAVEEGVRLVVEGAADIELGDLRGGHAEPGRELGGERGAGEHGRALVPEPLLEEAPTRRAGATRSTGLASVPSTHTTSSAVDPLDAGEVLDERAARTAPAARPACACPPGRRSGTLRAAASTGSTRPRATVMRAGQVVGQARPCRRWSRCGRSASVRRRPGVVDAGGELVVGDDAAGAPGQVGEAPAGELDAAGGGHDVLELVGLVDDGELVLGEEHARPWPGRGRRGGGSRRRRRPRGPLSRAASAKQMPPLGQRAAPGHSCADTLTALHARSDGSTSSSARSPVSVVAAQSTGASSSSAGARSATPSRASCPSSLPVVTISSRRCMQR